MLGFLAMSVITGMACAMASMLFFGVGLWMAVLWYIIGCWIGFAASVGAYLIASISLSSDTDRGQPKYS